LKFNDGATQIGEREKRMRIAHHMLTWIDWYRARNLELPVGSMLEEISTAGYAGVELIDGPELLGPAARLRTMLDDTGLQVAAYSSFVNATEYSVNTAKYRADLDYAAELGVRTIMVCGGWIMEPRRTAFDADYRAFADNLAAAGAYAERNGQILAFHPHMGCIVETAEEVDRLLAYCPELRLCLDTGHLAAVGSDPAALVRRHPDRVAHVHLKDFDTSAHAFAELGRGDVGLDFAGFLRALDAAGYSGWLTVERDMPALSPSQSATVSAAFLDGLARETVRG
jgi:inosose dehydratase